ncbi:MAG: phospholipase D-like domain-containing protein [Candidatus Altiarchaeota archaeon]|nr:phospholipase D-like domain-containing protein [Candidatus Altiarchaeota archaeon]
MKLDRNLVAGLLFGVVLGIILSSTTVYFADMRVCPQRNFVDEARITPVFNDGFFPVVHRALQDANKSIHLLVFELKYYPQYPESKMNILVEDIINASRRGVDVKIIVDQYSKENNAFDLLRGEGVDIVYDSEGVTTHAKTVIIDGRVVVLGSTNYSYYGLEKNNEVNVLIDSEETAVFYESYFREMWDWLHEEV